MIACGEHKVRTSGSSIRTATRALRRGAPVVVGVSAMLLLLTGGCPPDADGVLGGALAFNNTSDPTNQGASYVGSAACAVCHPDIAETASLHGHMHALTRVQGQPPEFPAQADRAGVPAPPDGRTWNDVSYIIGGYGYGGLFVDQQGFVMSDGVEGVNTLWTLEMPPNGIEPGFAAHLPDQPTPVPYDFDCFRCHATGAEPQSPGNPQSQDGRPGIRGTWAEAGVGCEACHGPGSNHVTNPQVRGAFVDATVQTCAGCHAGGGGDVIPAADGFIAMGAQYAELRASGSHADFACTICHDPHASTIYDRANGLRNSCRACHPGKNMTRFHEGKVFVRGDYVEELSCQSCHMPYATKTVSAVDVPDGVVNVGGRIGDTRTHIFRVRPEVADYTAMFSADGTHVLKDDQGRAAVTVDFVCLRCHSGAGNAFATTVPVVGMLAENMHGY